MTALMEPFPPWLRELNRVFSTEPSISTFVPPADVLVTDDGVAVIMDVPGVPPDKLEIELENDVLTVRGERPYPYQTDGARAGRRIERAFGKFERSLRVPQGLDPDAIDASMADGVLTLRLPKPEALKPRKIEIKAEHGAHELQGAQST
jgi:HSP20 family protein